MLTLMPKKPVNQRFGPFCLAGQGAEAARPRVVRLEAMSHPEGIDTSALFMPPRQPRPEARETQHTTMINLRAPSRTPLPTPEVHPSPTVVASQKCEPEPLQMNEATSIPAGAAPSDRGGV